MRGIVRFIGSKAKWRADPGFEQDRDFDHRAYKDVIPREREDGPSIFFVDDANKAKDVACLWAVLKGSIASVDYLFIDESIYQRSKLAVVQVTGQTGIKELDDLHGEIRLEGGLAISSLISQIVWTEGCAKRLSKGDLRTSLEGLVARRSLSSVRERIEKLLAK